MKLRSGFAIFVLLMIFTTAQASATIFPLLADEEAALRSLYSATDGANWNNNTNWLDDNPCHWHGVICTYKLDNDGHTVAQVKRLSLNLNNMIGTLPAAIFSLSRLEELDLSNNTLDGEIPESIGQLSQLSILVLATNRLTGHLPDSIGGLSVLLYLNVAGNQLTGAIPDSIGDLNALIRLYLSSNDFDGPIPASLGNLTKLIHLDLSVNSLSGEIPSSLGNLHALTYLSARHAHLSGQLPEALGNLQALKTLLLSDNQFDGSIAVALSQLAELQTLELQNNKLTGSIPDALGDLRELVTLSLYNNQLSGDIPDTLGELHKLVSLNLNNNQLSGAIPSSLGDLSSLERLYLSVNQLSGPIPAELGNLTQLTLLALYYNQLTGRVPDSLYALADKNQSYHFDMSVNDTLGEPLNLTFIKQYPWLAEWFAQDPGKIQTFGLLNCYPDTDSFAEHFESPSSWLYYSCGTQNHSCPEHNTGPQCMAGNPINLRTGVKQQAVSDFRAAGDSPLQLTRRYDSVNRRWSFNLLPPRLIASGNSVRVKRANGKSYLFSCYATTGDCRHIYRLGETTLYTGYRLAKFAEHYAFTLPSGATEVFDASGAMTTSTNAQGKTLTHSYSAQAVSVNDQFNQQLVFTLSDTKIIQAATSGGTFNYAYNLDGRLSTVTKPDGSTTHYHYDEDNYSVAGPGLGLLTGQTDSKGQRVASWYYDDQQRAYKSDHGAGIDNTEIRFISEWGEKALNEANQEVESQRVREVISPLGQRTRTTFVAPINQRAEKIEIFDSANTLIHSEHYQYDDRGYLIQSTDKQGVVTQYTRDVRGREWTRIEYANTPNARTITTSYYGANSQPFIIISPETRIENGYVSHNGGLLLAKQTITDRTTNAVRTTTFTYNPAGLLATIDGPRTDVNDITRFEYNAQGLRTKTTNALGHSTTITTFNATGKPTAITDANGDTITLTYDVMGRLLSSQQAEQIKRFTYDANGLLTQSTLANGSTIDYEYDTASRLIAMVDSLGNRLDYQLDAAGNRLQTQAKDINGSLQQTQQQLFDEFSRLSTVINGTGDSVNLTYAANGSLTDTTDALSNKTRNSYDALGRLAAIHDPNNGQTQYGYDAAGRTDSITDASGLKTTYRYNGFGEKTQQISPDTGETLYGYDSAGNLTSETDARGITVSYDYDALNRLIAMRYPDSSENIAFTYDSVVGGNKGIGRLTGIVDPSGNRQLRYGSLGQLLQETYTIGGQSYTLAYQYDSAGQLTGMIYPSGRQVDLTLNSLGQIEAMSTTASVENATPQSVMNNAAYLPFGPVRSFKQGNGLLNTLNYDRNYQLISQTLTGLKNQQLIYSATGNITAINQPSGSNQTFAYDKLSRLISATGDYGSLAYSYDAIGNRLSKTDNVSSSAEKVANYHYRQGSHHLGKITIGDVEQPPSSFSQFNQARRMSSVTNRQMKTSYQYDSRGLRVSKTTLNSQGSQIHYHYEPGGLLIGESNEKGIWQKEYLYFNARLIAMIDYSGVSNGVVNGGAGQIYYAHNDHLGTPKLLTDSTGKPVWQASYTPFGLAMINADADNNGVAVTLNIRFPGQYYDVESGLHYNWFRYYDPAIGRYVTSDPIGLAGGVNTYGYVGGNPVNYTDPQGLTSLRFNRATGVLLVDPQIEGRASYPLTATSGEDGCSCSETEKDRGPIPYGQYNINSSDVNILSKWETIKRNRPSILGGGDWGSRNVKITPLVGTEVYNRDGFYLHEGTLNGSAGCIDIGGGLFGNKKTKLLFEDILNDPNGNVPLTVYGQ